MIVDGLKKTVDYINETLKFWFTYLRVLLLNILEKNFWKKGKLFVRNLADVRKRKYIFHHYLSPGVREGMS